MIPVPNEGRMEGKREREKGIERKRKDNMRGKRERKMKRQSYVNVSRHVVYVHNVTLLGIK